REGVTFRIGDHLNDRFILIARRNPKRHIYTSDNGSNWDTKEAKAGYGGKGYKGLFYHDNKYFASGGDAATVGNTMPNISTSEDGLTWSAKKSISDKYILRSFAKSDKIIAGVGDFGRKAYSYDGLKWENCKNINSNEALIDIIYANGIFVGVGLHGTRMYSTDGKKWSAPMIGEEGEHINNIIFNGKQFIGVGLGGTYISSDGKSWQRHKNTNAPYKLTYFNGLYVGFKWKGKIFTSKDGINWSQAANLEGSLSLIVSAKDKY
ncbi:MAG: hypothetical protein NE330_20985, partial [Lentisphaeraceae bacterium]|nr:hypothetical protein [Lentisphaeraceae bacterium]